MLMTHYHYLHHHQQRVVILAYTLVHFSIFHIFFSEWIIAMQSEYTFSSLLLFILTACRCTNKTIKRGSIHLSSFAYKEWNICVIKKGILTSAWKNEHRKNFFKQKTHARNAHFFTVSIVLRFFVWTIKNQAHQLDLLLLFYFSGLLLCVSS